LPLEAMMLRTLLVLMLVLSGCAHVQKSTPGRSVNIGGEATLTLPEAKEILPDIQLVQVLTIKHKDKTHSSQVVLTSKENKLMVVALLPFGGEVFRIEYADGSITSKALPMVAADFDLRFALADIIMVYAKATDLKKWVSAGVEIVDSELTRDISYKAQPLIHIQYDKADKFGATIDYSHLTRNYQIHIVPLSQGTP
jgi:hypothetical protein